MKELAGAKMPVVTIRNRKPSTLFSLCCRHPPTHPPTHKRTHARTHALTHGGEDSRRRNVENEWGGAREHEVVDDVRRGVVGDLFDDLRVDLIPELGELDAGGHDAAEKKSKIRDVRRRDHKQFTHA